MIKKVFMLACITTTIVIGAPGGNEEPNQLEQLKKQHCQVWKKSFEIIMSQYDSMNHLSEVPGYIPIIITNLRSGTEQEEFDKLSGPYPLMAVEKGDTKVVEAFLQSGVNPLNNFIFKNGQENMQKLCGSLLRDNLNEEAKLRVKGLSVQASSQTSNFVQMLLIIQKYEIEWASKSQNQIKNTKNSH